MIKEPMVAEYGFKALLYRSVIGLLSPDILFNLLTRCWIYK